MASRARKDGERGFALLLVFAMAASIALLIYLEIPRVAFEHQRDKEALLVDRGEQYIRAIELYARKVNKLPQTLDDLEKTQNIRFLRKRYRDPMTNGDEWRLVHVDATGQYTDSKVHKRPGALTESDSGTSVLASRIQGIGSNATYIDQDSQSQSAATQKRASDRISPGSAPSQGAGTQQDSTGAGGAQAGGAAGEAGQNGPPPPPGSAATTQAQGSNAPPGGTSNAASGQTGANAAAMNPGGGQNGASGAGGSSPQQAIQAIQQLLGTQSATTPGGGGSAGNGAGVSTPMSGGAGAGAALGAGIVGVASKLDKNGILVYKDKTNYTEWEFLYEPKTNQQGQKGQQNQQNQQGQQGQNAAQSPGSSSNGSSFAGMSGGTAAPGGPSN
jgi:hypothetical protein